MSDSRQTSTKRQRWQAPDLLRRPFRRLLQYLLRPLRQTASARIRRTSTPPTRRRRQQPIRKQKTTNPKETSGCYLRTRAKWTIGFVMVKQPPTGPMVTTHQQATLATVIIITRRHRSCDDKRSRRHRRGHPVSATYSRAAARSPTGRTRSCWRSSRKGPKLTRRATMLAQRWSRPLRHPI